MLFSHPEFDDHRHVQFVCRPDVGLRAIIALHRSEPGVPAVGGIRFCPYATDEAALADVLRLSRAMTRKVVLAGLPVRGGKTVIVGDPSALKTSDLLVALAGEIDALSGRYLGGPDIGTTAGDMEVMRTVTPFVGGSTSRMGPGGSAPPTAEGVFNAVRALGQHLNTTPVLDGVHVVIQGVGAVGADLARRLAAAGATLTIADVRTDEVRAIADATGADVVDVGTVLSHPADILAPCALGGVLNETSIPALAVRGICGAANNQLATPSDAVRLHERGIVFVPDYVASAGGVIAGIAAEAVIEPSAAKRCIAQIFDRTLALLTRAAAEGVAPETVAAQMAVELAAKDASAA